MTKFIKATVIALTATVSVTASAGVAGAQGLPPLSQNKYVNDRLISARAADRIRRECPSIDARIIYAYSQARALKRYAEKQGYSGRQIDAFLDDKAEKKRIYGIADSWLTQQGAKKGDPESFCRVGRQEIARNSIVGSLLVAR
ncbi:DUF5333 domain-containing protein [Paracoccus pacificus]|uniref:DUF5333 domain-containing protein n=1 Tax=Paracoccus pacificus TaxID=1463598 RepID=A0ABW4RC83_9RHOB